MAIQLIDVIQRGTRAAQPLATDVCPGVLYFVTDELVTEQSDGATWNTYTDASLPLAVANSKLVGSGVAGIGLPYSELTLGSGLSITGTTVSATGTGGTVTSVGLAGTASQVTVTGSTPITGSGSWTLSIPSAAQLNVAKLTNLTTNGFVKTGSSDGTLSVDTATYAPTASPTFSGTVTIPTLALTIGADVAIDRVTMSGTLTLTTSSKRYQNLDPNGSARNCDLPANAVGLAFFVVNSGTGGEVITVRNAGAATVATLSNNEGLSVIADGTVWISAKATLVIV